MTTHRDDKAEKALRLREQGLDYKAIAERLGLRPSALYKMFHRAKRKREENAKRE